MIHYLTEIFYVLLKKNYKLYLSFVCKIKIKKEQNKIKKFLYFI